MDRKILNHLRSSTIGARKIKVVYLGKLGGFHYGKVIEAKARYVRNSCKGFPHPKWERCEYEIEDEDGDSYTVSENGRTKFEKDFYLVPEHLEVGTNIANITNYRDWRLDDEY